VAKKDWYAAPAADANAQGQLHRIER
jgi:hypothetical protein